MFLLSDEENSKKILENGIKYKKNIIPQARSLFRYLLNSGQTEEESLITAKEILTKTEVFFKYVDLKDIDLVLRSILDSAKEKEYLEIKQVGITKEEVDLIRQISSPELEKLYFTSLVLFRWNNSQDFIIQPKDFHILAKSKGSEADKMSFIYKLSEMDYLKVRTKQKGQDLFFCPKKFSEEGAEIAFQVRVTSDLVNNWIEFNKINQIQCQICGKWQKKRKNTHKYCPECFKQHRKEYNAEMVRRHRALKKQGIEPKKD